MKYSTTSDLTERICNEIGWYFEMRALETAKSKSSGQVHVRGTALKPEEASQLEAFCDTAGYKYHGPFAR